MTMNSQIIPRFYGLFKSSDRESVDDRKFTFRFVRLACVTPFGVIDHLAKFRLSFMENHFKICDQIGGCFDISTYPTLG